LNYSCSENCSLYLIDPVMETDDLEDLRSEILDLKGVMGNKNRGAVRSKISSWLAIIAIVFSLGTTAISAYNSYREDIRANRREAREIIQRLQALPAEQFDLMSKYKNSADGQALSAMLIAENVLLAIERYPDSFTSVEYFAVAGALAIANINTDKALAFYKKALEIADDANEYISTLNKMAQLHYNKGNFDEGGKCYQLGTEAWEKYEESDIIFKLTIDAQTYLNWSSSLIFIGKPDEAKEKIKLAKEKIDMMPDTVPMKDSLLLYMKEQQYMMK